MNIEELKHTISEAGYPTGRDASKLKDIKQEVIQATSFLDRVYTTVPIATRLFCIVNDINDVPLCEFCLKYTKIGPHRTDVPHYYRNGFRKYCSIKCSRNGSIELRKQNSLERHGVEHHMKKDVFKDKVLNTNMERYGKECYIATDEFREKYSREYQLSTGHVHHLADPDVIKQREERNIQKHGSPNAFQFSRQEIKDTLQEKYGVDNPMQLEEFREKRRNTCIDKYGHDHPLKSKELKEQIRKKFFDQHGVYNCNQLHFSEEFIHLISDRKLLEDEYLKLGSAQRIADKYQIGSHRTVLLQLHRHEIELNDPSKASTLEMEVREFLKQNNIEFVHSDRSIIGPKELDIVIDSHKLAIEVNGDYYHSDIYKPPNFHQNKVLDSHEKGYKLIHIYQHQLTNPVSKQIMLDKILFMCGKAKGRLYGRKCQVRSITNNDAKHFTDTYHIQGYRTAQFVYGLFYEENLVGVLSLRQLQSGVFDIVRFVTSMQVVGGFSKLLSYFKTNNEWKEIHTYASLDYGYGEVYSKNGFEFIGITPPNYFYVKNGVRYSRQQFMKHKLQDRLEFYDERLTEKTLMDLNGYLRVYDSGSVKYILRNT